MHLYTYLPDAANRHGGSVKHRGPLQHFHCNLTACAVHVQGVYTVHRERELGPAAYDALAAEW